MLHGQYEDWLNNTVLTRTIIPYCKAWNQDFARQMQTRLSREIRDMVYGYLWYFHPDRTSPHQMGRLHLRQHYTFTCADDMPDTIENFPLLLDITQSLFHVNDGNLKVFFDNGLVPHYLSSDYIGALTAHEVGVSLYHHLNKADLLQCESHHIKSMFEKDDFHVGLPMMDLIRSLTIHCKVDRYRTPPPDHKLSPKCNHSLSETAQICRERLRQDFSVLTDIKTNSAFKLHIILYQRNIRLSVLEEAVDTLGTIFQKFQQDRASLRVTWTYRGHWQNARGPPCHKLVNCDITDYLGEPNGPLGAAWMFDLIDVLDEVREDPEDSTCVCSLILFS